MTDLRESILAELRVKRPRAELVEALHELLTGEAPVAEVWLSNRAEIDTVEAYGLELTLDAAGNAVCVRFPPGAEAVLDG